MKGPKEKGILLSKRRPKEGEIDETLRAVRGRGVLLEKETWKRSVLFSFFFLFHFDFHVHRKSINGLKVPVSNLVYNGHCPVLCH